MKTFFTIDEIKQASRALDEARRTFSCPAPRTDASGSEHFTTNPGTKIAYGLHDAAFLQINIETLEVRCGVCAGELDATAKPKAIRKDKLGRSHFSAPV